ncbi:hypothetical protein HanRHA438_Chr10g0451811 [Helianthus annuus]|nr:hypothetical protein HanRHA438_Chr10g0451811 [Helianthus annuus]
MWGGECTVLPTAGVIPLREPLPDQASPALNSSCRVLTLGNICHSQDSNPVPLERGGCRWPTGLPQLVKRIKMLEKTNCEVFK